MRKSSSTCTRTGRRRCGPVLVLLAALAATIIVWVMLPTNDGGRIGVAVVGAISLFFAVTRGVWPLVVWRSDHYVFTDERVLLQDGVLTRERRDLPLNRINDHVMSQSLLDRMFGCGTLRIDSIGDQAAVLASVPRVHEVQTTLYELIETDRELQGRRRGRRERAGAPKRAAAALAPVGLLGRLELGQLGVQVVVGLGAQLGQAGGDVHLGDRGLVAVHRRLEEDERAVRPEAEDRGHARRGEA